jgi:hypothetical protein
VIDERIAERRFSMPKLIFGVAGPLVRPLSFLLRAVFSLASRKPWIEITPERKKTRDPAPLKIKEVSVEGRRYIVCLNQEERRNDAHDLLFTGTQSPGTSVG